MNTPEGFNNNQEKIRMTEESSNLSDIDKLLKEAWAAKAVTESEEITDERVDIENFSREELDQKINEIAHTVKPYSKARLEALPYIQRLSNLTEAAIKEIEPNFHVEKSARKFPIRVLNDLKIKLNELDSIVKSSEKSIDEISDQGSMAEGVGETTQDVDSLKELRDENGEDKDSKKGHLAGSEIESVNNTLSDNSGSLESSEQNEAQTGVNQAEEDLSSSWSNRIDELKNEIEVINKEDRSGQKKREVTDVEVADREREIYELEIKLRQSKVAPQIKEIKNSIHRINEEVQRGQKKTEVANEEVKILENKIYQLEGVSATNSQSMSEQVNVDVTGQSEGLQNETDVEAEKKAEYLNLKSEFKQAKAEFNRALETDLKNNGSLLKKFGFGRENMSKSVQDQYDLMMEANQKYLKFADANGFFDKINDRLHRKSEEQVSKLRSELNQAGLTIDDLKSIKTEENLSAMAEESGVSTDQLSGWREKSNKPYGSYDIRQGILNRHVANPAKERLAVQSLHMPPMLAKLKNSIMAKAAKHPNVAKVASVGFGATMAVVNPFAMAAGFATRYAGEKLFINKAEARVKAFGEDSLGKFFGESGGEVDLEQLEKEYFSGISDVDKYKVRTNVVAAGVAMGAAGGANAFGIDTPLESMMAGSPPDNLPSGEFPAGPEVPTGSEATLVAGLPDLPQGEAAPVSGVLADGVEEANELLQDDFVFENRPNSSMSPEAVTSTTEAERVYSFESHEVSKHETLSRILLDDLKEAFNSGEVNLPERVSGEGSLSSYLYEKFPEFTGAEGVEPALSPEQWKAVGVSSGDPNLIYPGERININALMEVLSDGSPEQVIDGVGAEVIDVASGNDVAGQEVPSALDPDQDTVDGYPTSVAVEGGSEVAGVNDEEAIKEGVSNSKDSLADVPKDLNDYYTPEVPPEKMFTMSEPSKALVSEFLGPSSAREEIFYKLISGVYENEITLPADMVVDGVDYRENIMGLVEKRLPELAPEKYPDARPALTAQEWAMLGVSGDPASTVLNEGDTLMTGKLMQFVLSGDKSLLFPKT